MAEVNMLSSASANQLPGPPHFVDLHVNSGESVAIQFFDGKETILRGPTTIKMISQHVFPPIPMPVHVPPGHMIQQIVDENGTLRHIILSAINGGDNSLSHSSFASNQQHHSTSNYCCCCSAVGSSSQASLVLPLTSQPLQPQQLSPINASFFPLNPSSYTRNRRSSRNYPSPNSKRINPNYNASNNYYNTNSTSKVTSSRSYKSENSKSTYYGRHASSLSNYTISRTDLNETTRFACKSQEYSCNSSNASLVSIMDQINDNSKYYKEDCYNNDEDVARKSKNELQTCCFDYNQDANNVNNVEVISQKSLRTECTNTTPDFSVNSVNYQMNHGVKRSKSSSHSSGRSVKSVSDNNIHDVDLKVSSPIHQHSTASKIKKDDIFNIELSQVQSKIHSQREKAESDNGHDAICGQEELLVLTSVERDDDGMSMTSISGKSISNGNLEHYLSAFDETSTAVESDKSESDESELERHVINNMVPRIVQQSPKHGLPKIEALTLSGSCISSSAVRLKWFFNQPTEYAEDKKHFIVDRMLTKSSDSPCRMVHQGFGVTCRISHLRPQQEYTFRVRSNTDNAMLISNLFTILIPEHQSASSSRTSARRGRQQVNQCQNSQQFYATQQVFEQNQQLSADQCTASEYESSNLVRLVCNPLSSDQRNALIILTLFTFFAMFVAVGIQNFLGASQ